MPTKIQLKRGTNSKFNSQNLSVGEPAFVTDTGKLYVGDGSKKVLINPIDKPVGIQTNTAYTKVKVNEYGQVVEQSNLTAQDIPTTPPPGVNSLYSYYSGPDISVGSNQVVPLNAQVYSGTGIILNGSGGVTVSIAGTYWVSYHVSAAAPLLKVALSSAIGDTTTWTGSMSVSSTSALTPYTTACATIIRPINIGENIYIKNMNLTPTVFMAITCSLCVVRIA